MTWRELEILAHCITCGACLYIYIYMYIYIYIYTGVYTVLEHILFSYYQIGIFRRKKLAWCGWLVTNIIKFTNCIMQMERLDWGFSKNNCCMVFGTSRKEHIFIKAMQLSCFPMLLKELCEHFSACCHLSFLVHSTEIAFTM